MKKTPMIICLMLCLVSCNLGGHQFIGKWQDYYGGVDQFGDGSYMKWLIIVKWGNGYKVSYHYGGNTNPPFIDFNTTAQYRRGALYLDDNIQLPQYYSLTISYNNDTIFYNGDKYRHVPDD